VVRFATLAAFVAAWSMGCGQGTEVKLAEAPPPPPVKIEPLPKDMKKGGGTSSSGNLHRNPGADPLGPK
jgi:hypothetical protein